MSKNKTYCGIGKIPANHKRGSANDCYKKNQIRYYGLKTVSKEMFGDVDKTKKKLKELKKEQDKIHREYVKLTGSLNGNKRKMIGSKTDKDREKYRKICVGIINKKNKIVDKYEKLGEKIKSLE